MHEIRTDFFHNPNFAFETHVLFRFHHSWINRSDAASLIVGLVRRTLLPQLLVGVDSPQGYGGAHPHIGRVDLGPVGPLEIDLLAPVEAVLGGLLHRGTLEGRLGVDGRAGPPAARPQLVVQPDLVEPRYGHYQVLKWVANF